MAIEVDYFEDENIDLNALQNLRGKEFINCNFEAEILSELDFSQTRFIECVFKKCNLSNADFRTASFRDVTFQECKLLGINWTHAGNVDQIKFESSILNMGVFNGLEIRDFSATDCTIKDVDFSQAGLKQSIFTDCDLSGTNFTGCNLFKADFRGAKNYAIDPQYTNVRSAKFNLSEAVSFFKSIGIIVE